MRPGPLNLITDVPGLAVGNAQDSDLQTGVTVLTGQQSLVTSAHVMGGAPGTRETDLLSPEALVGGVDALVLSGGSALGLAAADGVSSALRVSGRGYSIHGHLVPIVPCAIIFDLTTGMQEWTTPPWHDLGFAAINNSGANFLLGSIGAGIGATTANLKGGLGSASAKLGDVTVGALAVANPIGSVTVGETANFWAAAFEEAAEFGGLGPAPSGADPPVTKPEAQVQGATVIAIVATDLALDKAQAKRLAVMAHDGIARSVVPSHTPFDGDIVFAVSTGERVVARTDLTLIRVGHAAATCLARAIARGVFAASPAPGDAKPAWRAKFG
ncbi:MAG: P1 family peptidase [Pseudomonadota bacterium]